MPSWGVAPIILKQEPSDNDFVFLTVFSEGSSGTWIAPTSGWYRFYAIGASGDGSRGFSYYSDGSVNKPYAGGGGGSGGTGALAISQYLLNAGDQIPFNVIARGQTNFTYNGTTVVAGAGSSAPVLDSTSGGSGGAGGYAANGNLWNLNGIDGAKGGGAGYGGGRGRASDGLNGGGTGGNNGSAGSNYRGGGGGAGGSRLPGSNVCKYIYSDPYPANSLGRGGAGGGYERSGGDGYLYPDTTWNNPTTLIFYGSGAGGGGRGHKSKTDYGQGAPGSPSALIIERANI